MRHFWQTNCHIKGVLEILHDRNKWYEQDETFWSEVRHMATHPKPSIALLASDQADVIQIYLELKRAGNCADRAFEATTTNKPLGPHNDSHEGGFPRELLDFE